MLSRETGEMWKNRWLFPVTVAEWIQCLTMVRLAMEQDTVYGQGCCKLFSSLSIKVFCTGKGWCGEDFLNTGIVKWNNWWVWVVFFCFGWTFDTDLEFKIPAPHSPTGWKLWSLLSPCAFVPSSDPTSHKNPMKNSPLQLCFSEASAGAGAGADAPAWTKALHLGNCWSQPCSGGGGWGRDEHLKTLGKDLGLLPAWCKNTAGLTQAVAKPWTLAGIRWLGLETFTGEGQLKEQNQHAKQTSHCQLPVQGTWA